MVANEFIIRQISVFSENRPGRLAAIAHALEEERVNIFAFSIAEASGFGVVRALVDQPDRAHARLTQEGFNVAFTDVIAVRMRDEPGGLYEVAAMLAPLGDAELVLPQANGPVGQVAHSAYPVDIKE